MAEITKINSKMGLVSLTERDLIEHDLIKWIRSSFKGIGKSGLITDTPFETVAAALFVEKNPECQIHLATKCLLKPDNTVDVILKVSSEVSENLYNQNDTDLKIETSYSNNTPESISTLHTTELNMIDSNKK